MPSPLAQLKNVPMRPFVKKVHSSSDASAGSLGTAALGGALFVSAAAGGGAGGAASAFAAGSGLGGGVASAPSPVSAAGSCARAYLALNRSESATLPMRIGA